MANATINCTAWMAGSVAGEGPDVAYAWSTVAIMSLSLVSLSLAALMQYLEVWTLTATFLVGGILSWLTGFFLFVFYFADNVGGHRHYERVCYLDDIPSRGVFITSFFFFSIGPSLLLYMFVWGANNANMCECFSECYDTIKCDECLGCCENPFGGTQPQAKEIDREPLLEEKSDIERGGSKTILYPPDGTASSVTPGEVERLRREVDGLKGELASVIKRQEEINSSGVRLAPNNDLSLRGIPEWQRDL